ncbi:hypothetical protein [Branchiibius sp. NY16-3462-2]|uniref:hypothetical protein n=1 Tax=Branchiibius sp. NY16-3462-2 TaxID=1807500 RepID=UPI00079299D2|nr:hypothetical protein [Branchiibius sp. NY16-3462-2]KYH45350.1 hypothetical protein AZH51_05620 [Branchiibius sp. NY16-3462-2]
MAISLIRTTVHHARIHRAAPQHWTWQCTCGGGNHLPDAARTQRAAFIAGLVHVDQQPAA